jgi:hypothetical protein
MDLNTSKLPEGSLDTIKLLQLTWDQDGSGLEGRLSDFTLSSCPPFTCVSYVWGDTTKAPKHTITTNGRPLGIFNSLYSFLELIRDAPEFSDDMYWWIDSICINQENFQEKNAQVAIMKKIYETSQRTIVWLGEELDRGFKEETQDCVGAIASMKVLVRKKKEALGPRVEDNEARMEAAKLKLTTNRDNLGVNWDAVERLLLRPWWRRVWTLQEMCVPERVTIYCGKNKIHRQAMYNAIHAIYLCRGSDGKLISRTAWDAGWNRRRISQWYRYNNNTDDGKLRLRIRNQMHLVAMIAYVSNCDTSDDRDRIYSVRGLVADSHLVPETRYDRTIAAVYMELVRSFITRYNRLDIICLAHVFRRPEGTKNDLPTWVPDWRVKVESKVMPVMASHGGGSLIGNFGTVSASLHTSEDSYSADGIVDPDKKILKSEIYHCPIETRLVLPCEGFIVDYIDGLGWFRYGDMTREHGMELPMIQPTSSGNHSPQAKHSGDNDLMETISRSLVLDREDRYLKKRPPPYHFRDDFIAFSHAVASSSMKVHPIFASWFTSSRSFLIRGQTLESHCLSSSPDKPGPVTLNGAEDLEDINNYYSFLARFRDTTDRMEGRLTVTDEGHFGITAAHARKGDIVCVLLGCSIPVVLRPVGEKGRYEFIGECYLYGFMYGAAVGNGGLVTSFELV